MSYRNGHNPTITPIPPPYNTNDMAAALVNQYTKGLLAGVALKIDINQFPVFQKNGVFVMTRAENNVYIKLNPTATPTLLVKTGKRKSAMAVGIAAFRSVPTIGIFPIGRKAARNPAPADENHNFAPTPTARRAPTVFAIVPKIPAPVAAVAVVAEAAVAAAAVVPAAVAPAAPAPNRARMGALKKNHPKPAIAPIPRSTNTGVGSFPSADASRMANPTVSCKIPNATVDRIVPTRFSTDCRLVRIVLFLND
jgi:hypothetical protein